MNDVFSPLVTISRDLTASLASSDRYQRFLQAAAKLIPFDAACLLRLDGEFLHPLAGMGLLEQALQRDYDPAQHPRLRMIIEAVGPIQFPLHSPLPDPFDGMVADAPQALEHIHACMGCPLFDGDELVGALTADALDPHAFDEVDPGVLATLGALAGAALRTSLLIEALEARELQQRLIARDLQRSASGGHFIGQSAAARQVLQQVSVVAGSDLPVLITGPTGVGKELVARMVHARSQRNEQAFIQVNCAALPASLAESELFGHIAGAFTGASQDRAGKFEIADKATLFLDEIGELPISIQGSLLRALQQGEIQRIGSDVMKQVDVRVVAATNRDLEKAIQEGRFRADLYHRLAGFPIEVPSLQQRRSDIPLLVEHFAEDARTRLGFGPIAIPATTIEALQQAAWPGNVRELSNVLQRGILMAAAEASTAGGGCRLESRHMNLRSGDARSFATAQEASQAAQQQSLVSEGLSLRDRVLLFQRQQIEQAVAAEKGNWAAAARSLGMHRANLHNLAKRLGLSR